MANTRQQLRCFTTISSFHLLGACLSQGIRLSALLMLERLNRLNKHEPKHIVFDFYGISVKRILNANMEYGQ